MQFEFATANRIIFGEGVLGQVGERAAEFGQRALVVCGRSVERAKGLRDILKASGVNSQIFSVPGEPTVEIVQRGVQIVRQGDFDLIVAFGGGSALDAGKAMAAMATNPGELLDYLEVIGRGKPLNIRSLPWIGTPTTAGAGAEVTRNAVLESSEHRVKVSLRSPGMLASLALVDPELTYDLPQPITASSGMDALSQLIEPYVSNKANPLADALCREGLSRVARGLRRAYNNGRDAHARRDMALASLFGGLVLANAKLGAVHGFAGVLGGMYGGPHGEICARLLPMVMDVNVMALETREAPHPASERYAEVAQILTGDQNAQAADGIAWLQALVKDLDIPRLSNYGLAQADFPEVIQRAAVSSSMQGNPIKLTYPELEHILETAL